MRTKDRSLMVASIFGMLLLIIMFIFAGMFILSIVNSVDENAVSGTELQNVSAVIEPLGAGMTWLIPVFIGLAVVGLIIIAFTVLLRSRAR